MKSLKLKNNKYLDASGIFDHRELKTQEEINSNLKSALATLREDVDALRTLVRGQISNNWGQIQEVVKRGFAPKFFEIGDQLEVNWEKDGTVYSLPFDIVSFDSVVKEGESEPVPGLWLESHYTMDAVTFDAGEAMYVTDAALPAGTYYFTFGTNFPQYCEIGKSYYFTTTQEIPASGQILFSQNNDIYAWHPRTYPPKYWRVHTFGSASALTPLETGLTLTEGTEGTRLGRFYALTQYGESGINNLLRSVDGYNRWSMSAMRQYLNSTETKGGWWTPQNPFDRPPRELNTLDGFMKGFDSDFLSILGKVKVTTALNINSDSAIGESEETYDTFFVASLEQEYFIPEVADVEGPYWPYWKDRLSLDSPQERITNNTDRIRYAYDLHDTARTYIFRSPKRDKYSGDIWDVGYNGMNGSSPEYSNRPCPVCVIC